MNISTKTRYGTRLLLELARSYGQDPLSVGDVAKRVDLSVKYLEQILRPLKKAGLVNSIRGPKGGHALAMKPKEVTLGQIVRVLESKEVLVECVNWPEKCTWSGDCSLRVAWREATAALYEKLDSFRLSDLLEWEDRLGGNGAEP